MGLRLWLNNFLIRFDIVFAVSERKWTYLETKTWQCGMYGHMVVHIFIFVV